MSDKTPDTLLADTLLCHYEDLVAHVRRHIRRVGGDTTPARDIVHDALISLTESPAVQPIRTPLAFLRSLLTRRAIDAHRVEAGRRAWVRSVEELPEPVHLLDESRDPFAILDRKQRIELLDTAIQSLSPACREVFILSKVHHMSRAEVADWQGISVKTVDKHLGTGMAVCRKAFLAAFTDGERGTPPCA
ncbi:RNA polymerase sigma factor [Thauera linaloolentis]|uniref:Uncharacterized protein n=1 Tax=Thauera linaloolentis (strain DSM 12138 / JCM 21573 / CCUG 41526 / CIP 105981 / IAM 15112 / NBRC 102519 / 47Lol) TaxID=1123367 RepID=N6YWJ3_THAL4|nr:RNA polymerase sigma factor [Thauera linaloolentis]ENO84319.1 hypothetical protein C666_17570 [Thauera linaloolentis 47Lol = DSM 12138]MCM8564413.1 RNA polymerase sigma factor [Thauera linaloolentis]